MLPQSHFGTSEVVELAGFTPLDPGSELFGCKPQRSRVRRIAVSD
jgi:hypothetical protein